MVTRETSYIGQLYFGLSTDDPTVIEWHNGDRILLMDEDKMMVYDGASFTFHEIPMSGGGGGGEENEMIPWTITVINNLTVGTAAQKKVSLRNIYDSDSKGVSYSTISPGTVERTICASTNTARPGLVVFSCHTAANSDMALSSGLSLLAAVTSGTLTHYLVNVNADNQTVTFTSN